MKIKNNFPKNIGYLNIETQLNFCRIGMSAIFAVLMNKVAIP